MKPYGFAVLQMNPKTSEESKALQEEYIHLHTPRLKAEAMPYVVAREVSRFTTDEIGKIIGTSETVVKNFEQGKLIDRSELIAKSYSTALSLIYVLKYGIDLDIVNRRYSPIDLLEHFIKLNGELGIILVQDAVNSINLLYNFDWRVKMSETSNEYFEASFEKQIMVYDYDSEGYFLIFQSNS